MAVTSSFILDTWLKGGWVMAPLGLLALFVYALGAHLLASIPRYANPTVGDEHLRHWIQQPEHAQGEVGRIIRYTQQASSLDDLHNRYSEVMNVHLPAIERRLTLMTVMTATAPLLGLLGTVLGMLKTFESMSSGIGKVPDLVAQGISEALITTEMGLLIAIPGGFLAYLIRRRKDHYTAFLARLESSALLQSDTKLR